ncbi:unnamed protein product [Scytosiphon promiscuus]
MVAPEFMQAFILLGIVVVLVVVCILFQARPRPEAYSHEELTQIRIDRELAKEEVLEEKAHQLKGRARIHRRNRLILSARKDADLMLQSAQERWDARGRSIYGDAWDDPQDGNLPLRTLFNLPSQEIDLVREEAKRLLQPDWPRSDHFPLPFPPNDRPYADDGPRNGLGVEKRGNGMDGPQIMTAPACRELTYGDSSTLSKTDAYFVDTRFVHLPTPAIVPPLDFARLGNGTHSPSLPEIYQPPTAAAEGATCPKQNPGATTRRKNVHITAGPTTMTTAANDESTINSKQGGPDQSSLALSTSIQDPGLRYPRPPSIPPPKAKRDEEGIPLLGRKSLSARLANFTAAGTTGRVVPIELV